MAKIKRRRIVLIALGCCCIIAAAALGLYNGWIDDQAGQTAEGLTSSLSQMIQAAAITDDFTPDASFAQEELNAPTEQGMGYRTIDSYDICGSVSIPAIRIELAVINEWTKHNLDVSACRYSGLPEDKMVIVAHNYVKHFGKLGNLIAGDVVRFTDVEGKVYEYEVYKSEIIDEEHFSDIIKGDEWDLTLFTCTYSRASRVVVRCALK